MACLGREERVTGTQEKQTLHLGPHFWVWFSKPQRMAGWRRSDYLLNLEIKYFLLYTLGFYLYYLSSTSSTPLTCSLVPFNGLRKLNPTLQLIILFLLYAL
jgi:hypothetical protein